MTGSSGQDQLRAGIVCLSHLGWDNVWQRPQHILSRFAQHYPVIYINEPDLAPGPNAAPGMVQVAREPNLGAWQPLVPDNAEALGCWRELYVELVQDLLVAEGWAHRSEAGWQPARPLILWFYTPTPHYFLEALAPSLVVYDVMDELAAFKGGAADLPERETKVLAAADVVFAGGRSLFEARRGRHPNLHLFASGVEPEHFALASLPETQLAPELLRLPHPILGYYGVIDERTDLDLIRELAAARPDWSIVMVGPVAKINPGELPQAPNLHWIGRQPYERLPAFLKGFDVCIMPFARNGATRYISPTKTLEFMAAHKPIVSTPVPDVVANWSDVVRVAGDASHVARAIEACLEESPAERRQRLQREDRYVARSTWDAIVGNMQRHIEAALQKRCRRLKAPARTGERARLRSRSCESTCVPTIE
jgi:UDP-galactopyranose mutase